jgi:HEAT repeat protein
MVKYKRMPNLHWPQLIQDLRGDNIDRAVRACEEISETADETNIAELYSLLNDDNFFIREAAALPLARLEGARALPSLFRAMTRGVQDGHDNDGMCAAIWDLFDLNQEEVLPLLQNMLNDEDKNTRAHAAWAMGYYAKQISPNILINLLDSESNIEVRAAAIGSLSSFKGSPDVVDKLISLLNEPNEQIIIDVISSLGYLGDKRAVIPLKEVLKISSSSRIREFAKSALKRLGA